MRFEVLGPVQVVVDSRPVRLASARQREVLTVLLLSANRSVSVDKIIDAVWGQRPVPSAQNLVRTYVWRLRALLTDHGGEHVVTEPAGYLLQVAPGELDLAEFESLLAEGTTARATGEVARAAQLLGSALSLWRGEPFADVNLHDAELATEIQRLGEARLSALEERIECDLALGRHRELIGELDQLTRRHPLRERLTGQLMLACYRADRRADALAGYRELSARLGDELGLDPCPELQELNERMLRGDSGLLPGSRASSADRDLVPRQLPAAPAYFSGRTSELGTLTSLLDREAGHGGIAVISAIAGAAGIGKTTLAVYWGHRNQDRFPDGQLYVDLRGFAPECRPVSPAAAVRGFLDALGVPAERMPQSCQAQVALYRSMVAGRRMVIVLDNALDTDQVRPLLPGSPSCLTVITSRNSLTGLIAAEGACPITLELFTPTEAHDLLSQRLGVGRVTAEPKAVGELIEICARLPLALNIVSARAITERPAALAALADQLRDLHARLDAFDIGDRTTDLRAAFSWSYQRLSESTRRLFRLLALHPGPGITVPAVASLAALPLAVAREAVDDLLLAHLLTESAPGRYAFHDLLRVFAVEQADCGETASSRAEAAERLLGHYLHTAYAADRLLRPAREDRITPIPLPRGVVPEDLVGEPEALTWLEAEHEVLLAVADQVFTPRFDAHAWQLAWALAPYLDRYGRWRAYATVQQTALTAWATGTGRPPRASAWAGPPLSPATTSKRSNTVGKRLTYTSGWVTRQGRPVPTWALGGYASSRAISGRRSAWPSAR